MRKSAVRLAGKASSIASDRYMDPKLTHIVAKMTALAVAVDTLIKAALDGEDVSPSALALYGEYLSNGSGD